MRASSALAVLAVLALAHVGAASTLFQEAPLDVAAVSQQRSRSLLQSVPVYNNPVCPGSNYPALRKVRVVLTITGGRFAPAFFGLGQKALFDKIRPVYTKTGRPSILQRQIVGPAGQLAVRRQKNFIYDFTLPLGKCGADKKALSDQLAQAIKNAAGGRVRRVRLSSFA